MGTVGFSDADHLAAAGHLGRALLSHNVHDFHALHGTLMNSGVSHAGLVLAHQLPPLSSSEIVRRVVALAELFDAERLTNQLLFLSNFG